MQECYFFLQLNKKYKIKVIQVNAYTDEDVGNFYKNIIKVLNCSQTQKILLVRYFNAKLGCKADPTEMLIGSYLRSKKQKKKKVLVQIGMYGFL